MTPERQTTPPIRALLLALMIVPPIAIFGSIPWLRDQPDELVFLLGGVAAVVTVVSSFALGIMHDRKLDEWQRTGTRFASQWGWVTGASLIALLIALPPVREMVVSLILSLDRTPGRDIIWLAFVFGFMAVVMTQALSTALLSVVWFSWMSRGGRGAE